MPKNPAIKKAARAHATQHGVSYIEGLNAVKTVASPTSTVDRFAAVQPGDLIRFVPQSNRNWWTVWARNERFLVATQQAPFQPKGTPWYTVVDLTGWNRTYNGVGPGVVRSSLNTLGGGWEVTLEGGGCQEILAGLEAGRWTLSSRRVCSIEDVEIKTR
jgi:hypothetical protein